jgi:hypothetical protein
MMIYLGVLPTQIITAGYGEQPDENSAIEWSKQRRVDGYFKGQV